VLGEDGCPVRFQCDELSDDDYESCVHKGKIYRNREHIQDVGPCDSCNCQVDEGSAYIECAEVDCPDWEPRNKSCYMGRKPDECCPVEMCPNEKESRKVCKYNGKEYKIGQYIQTSKPCKRCICTEEWTGENGPGCSEVDCLVGMYAPKIRKGCLPIYIENGCCLTEMYCDGLNGATSVTPADEDTDNYCQYRGRYYEKGSTAYLETDKYRCIECTCSTPPDFTCLRKTCPPKPRDDCIGVYGHCCPRYECP